MRNQTHRSSRNRAELSLFFSIVALFFAIPSGCAGAGPDAQPNITDSDGSQSTSPLRIGEVDESNEVSSMETSLIEQGRRHLANSRWQRAAESFQRALALDRYNVEAREGLADAMAYQNQGSTLDQVATDVTLRRKTVFHQFQSAIRRAGDATENGNYQAARGMVLTAIAALDQERTWLSVNEYEVRRRQAMEVLSMIDQEVNRSTPAGNLPASQ